MRFFIGLRQKKIAWTPARSPRRVLARMMTFKKKFKKLKIYLDTNAIRR
jgi:hypothetical protein